MMDNKKCQAMQYSDQMLCKRCDIGWDMNDPYPPECGIAQAAPVVAASKLTDEQAKFTAWLAREMPAGTVISDPAWWAPRILRAAQVAAPAASVAVPAGYAVVPTTITEEMHVAAVRAIQRATGNDDFPRAVWTAMVAAAPATPAAQAQQPAGDGWISVAERLPEGQCIAAYKTEAGSMRLIRAKYVRQFQIEAEGDDCETEYNEGDDTFYIKAGWLECIDNWGEYSSCYVVEGTVTHWMPLPPAPGLMEAE